MSNKAVWSRAAAILAHAAIFVTTTACAQLEHAGVRNAAPAEPAREVQRPKSAEELVHAMGQDLAQRLDVKITELEVLAVDQVVWSDGALGCPQPGQNYLMAQVPGLRALFQYQGKTYQYHGSDRGAFVYCPNPQEPAGKFDRE